MVVGLAVGKRESRPWIVSDELWLFIEPLLPEPVPNQVEGRPRVPDRQALCGILFVLHTGIRLRFRGGYGAFRRPTSRSRPGCGRRVWPSGWPDASSPC
ncbi:transposase [Streptomyces sp. NPDC055796]